MNEDIEKTIQTDTIDLEKVKQARLKFSRTAEIDRRSLINEIPAKQHGFLEITQFGYQPRHIELDEEEAVIGRSSECDVQLFLDNVSRKHARIIYTNEDYLIEDLDSTNGVYVNGIKVARCILRNHDQIEIGDVKIVFNEEKIRKTP